MNMNWIINPEEYRECNGKLGHIKISKFYTASIPSYYTLYIVNQHEQYVLDGREVYALCKLYDYKDFPESMFTDIECTNTHYIKMLIKFTPNISVQDIIRSEYFNKESMFQYFLYCIREDINIFYKLFIYHLQSINDIPINYDFKNSNVYKISPKRSELEKSIVQEQKDKYKQWYNDVIITTIKHLYSTKKLTELNKVITFIQFVE